MKSTMRWLILVLGILLVLVAFGMFATPGANAVVMGYLVCFLMLVYGVCEIVYYCIHHKEQVVSGWLLADGIITTVLGLLLVTRPAAQILTMSVIFAVWVLFTGVTRTSGAFAAKSANDSGWGWMLAAGMLGILIGIWFLFNPAIATATIGFLLPIVLLMQGISAIFAFFATKQ